MGSSKLGKRWVCFSCRCKFYDLNKPAPLCPKCGTDQTKAPKKDSRFSAPVSDNYEENSDTEESEELDLQEEEGAVSGEKAEDPADEDEE